MATPDPALWQRLSPLLDDLLDLDAAARAPRIAALRAEEPALADALADLLAQHDALAAADFLGDGAAAVAGAPRLQAGQRVGAYTLVRELGRGGMGEVWLARRTDGRYDGEVAIKLLAGQRLGTGPGAAARFAREGQILARLAHPHIARLLDAGVTEPDGQPFLVLEAIDGLPITEHCRERDLDIAARVDLFLDVLAAVAHAHQRLILHRDLKPSNILVERESGAVKLLDFGIAKLVGDAQEAAEGAAATEITRQAGRAYTLQYAAPEQVQGDDVTTATDVYALGVLLYQLLSGHHPTAGRTTTVGSELALMREVVEIEPRRLSEQARRSPEAALRRGARGLRGDLDTIVAKALKKSPAERYANAQALADDLRRWRAHEPIAARPDARLYTLGRFLRRHRVGVAATAAVALALVGGTALALWQAREAQAQRLEAEGLIEFMLGDLRRKLDPVGRLDVLDAVGERALAYYARQDIDGADADALGRRARALHLMGEIADKRARRDEAERLFTEAARSTAELLARAPAEPQRLFDHAQSHYWVGYAAWQQGKSALARTHFGQYLALAQALVAQDAARAEWRMEEAWAEQNLAVVAMGEDALAEALQRLARARALWTPLAAQRADARTELGNTLGWLAEAQERAGRLDEAIATQQAKQAALAGGAADDARRQTLDAATQAAVARLHLAAGRDGPALAAAEAALALYDGLAQRDTDNLETLLRAVTARLQHAETARDAGRPVPVGDAARIAADLARLEAAGDARPRGVLRPRLRWLRLRCATDTTACADLAAFLDGPGAALGPPAQASTDNRLLVAQAWLQLAEAGDATAARRALAWLGPARTPAAGIVAEPALLALRAQALWRLGENDAAQREARQLEGSGYRHPAWQATLARWAGVK